jgi:hypothetical protein
MFFDGSSLGAQNKTVEVPVSSHTAHIRYYHAAAYVFAVAVYVTVTIPALRTIATPVVNVDTREDRVEAMRILSAGNTIIMVILGAILALQVTLSVVTPRLRRKLR